MPLPNACRNLLLLFALFGSLATTAPIAFAQSHIETIAVVLEPDASAAETLAAGLLKNRILEVTSIRIDVADSSPADADLRVYLGTPRSQGHLADILKEHEIILPSRNDAVFPEGFALKSLEIGNTRTLVALADDERALIYAVGEIVRRLRYFEAHVELPDVDFQSAPGFRYRGFSANQGGTMMKIANARPWTEAEIHGVVLEYALAGGNTFYSSEQASPFQDFLKSHALMTVTGARPNELRTEFPPEWAAHGREAWEGKQWVCPSVPEARAALMKQWEEDFSKRAFHDVMRFYAGDPGGCTCERCTPWGKTFVYLCEEMAAIWLRLHPGSTVQIANQGLDNAGDRAILDYLNEKPRPWSYGICYGPGSNAMSPYFRDIDMRDDLFAYAGHGAVNRYLAELHRGLPADQHVVHYSDITHYISAQYAADDPDVNFVRTYGRRTFHARPAAMYATFQAIMPFSEGDIIYSEGNHDEFHQYLWARLLWNPNRTLENVMTEYCTLYFGEEAVPKMVYALLQLEKNLTAPLAENEGIARYYDLVKQAGEAMPAWRMNRDYRWHLHMQKAALDRYVQLKLRIELDKEQRVRTSIEAALRDGITSGAILKMLDILAELAETSSMQALREEARILGEDTDKRHGDRNPGYFRLDQSLRNLPTLVELIEKARDESNTVAQRKLLQDALDVTAEPTPRGNIFL